jgi:hypothetical protein
LEAQAPVPLHSSSDKGLSVPGFSSHGGAQCDAKGNLYFKIGTVFNDTQILRLSSDGSDRVLYTLQPDYVGKSAFFAFRAIASGTVYALVEAEDGIHVFSWTPDGNASEPSDTHLDTPKYLSPSNFAVFKSGAVLLGGYFKKDAPEGLRGKRYLAEFDASGRLRVKFNRDDPGVDLSKRRPALDAPATTDEHGLMYIAVGDVILVISEGGEVVRELMPTKPSREYLIAHIQAAGGRLGVWFLKPEARKPTTTRLAVVDPTSGDILRLYQPDDELGNNSVCFTGDAFTFFRVRDGYVRLLTASVR